MSAVMSFGEDEVAMTTTGQTESSFRLLRQLNIMVAIRGSSSFPSLSFPKAWMLHNNRTQGEQKTAKQRKKSMVKSVKLIYCIGVMSTPLHE